MTDTLRHRLERVLPTIAPALIGPEASCSILDTVKGFPACLDRTLCFECRLSPEQHDRVDLQFGIGHSSPAHQWLAGEASTSPDQPALPNAEGWSLLRDFSRDWMQSQSERPAQIWLGLDIDPQAPAPSSPLVHVRTSRLAGEQAIWWIERLRGGALTASQAATLLHCFKSSPLPPRYIAVMFARRTVGLRMVCAMPHQAALPYLDNIGWPGDLEAAQFALGLMAPWCRSVGLSLDVSDTVHPYLGFEAMNWEKPKPALAQWRATLDDLVSLGLSSTAHAEALAKYPGLLPEPRMDGETPNHVSVLRRQLLHLKLVLSAEQALDVKAYLALARDHLSKDIGGVA